MPGFGSLSAPSEFGLGTNVRDTGTINIIFPDATFTMTMTLEGPIGFEEVDIVIAQGGDQATVATIDLPEFEQYGDWWFGTGATEEPTKRFGARTRDDSGRIVGQLDPNRGWSIDGLGPGPAELQVDARRTGVVHREDVTLTGGPPTLDDVVVESITPEQVAPLTAGGTFTVASPVTRGAEADVEVTLEDAESGRRVGIQTFPISIPGAIRLGAVNRSEFELPTTEFVEGRDLRICAELVDVRVP